MDNLGADINRAILMVLAMQGFAVEDMIIKIMAGYLPTWQIIGFLGTGGALVSALLLVWQGQALFLQEPVGWRRWRDLGRFSRCGADNPVRAGRVRRLVAVCAHGGDRAFPGLFDDKGGAGEYVIGPAQFPGPADPGSDRRADVAVQ